MPLEIESPARHDRGSRRAGAHAMLVGLVNNMPDAALEATEAQFTRLLQAAAGAQAVRLRFFSLPEVPRAAAARAALEARGYWRIEELPASAPDALIVTGMEPGGGPLSAESYWPRFVDLLEWADANTISSVWSCLAAHAAVLHLSGLLRQRLPHKLCGVFAHDIRAEHPLMAGVSAPLRLPHSRWNDLPPAALRAAGYAILSSSAASGADTFVRQQRSLLLCFQGHPEYEEVTLLKEFRRDVGRFLRGEQSSYPLEPRHYFAASAAPLLEEFRARATAAPCPQLLADFPAAALGAGLRNTWQDAAARLYRNWLAFIAAARAPAARAAMH